MTPTVNSPLYKKADKKGTYATLLLLLSIGITFFVTAGMYSDFSQKKEEKSSIDAKIESLKTELDSLNKKKDQVANDKATRDAIAQYASMYREDLILNQVYAKLDGVTVHDVALDKGQKLPNGLSMANVNFSVDARSVNDLNKYLDYLTQESSNLRFVVKSVTMPLNSESVNSTITAGLSLGMYYFEQK